jgi:SAM-dependent methyltransferase
MNTNGHQTIGACRVCDSPDVEFLCETPNEHSVTTTIDNFRCRECGCVFVGNIISSEELGQAYSSLDSTSYYADIATENRQKMAAAIEHLNEFASKGDSIIDIGTGNGMFVQMLTENGFLDVSAHEIKGSDLSLITEIASHIYQDHDYGSIPSESFGSATLLDVVEHVPVPAHLINACSRILKAGGYIYFHTPVVTRTDRVTHFVQKIPGLKKMGIIWQRGRTSVFHLQNYSVKAIIQLLKNAGFTDIEIQVKNELSWPVRKYVEIYLLDRLGLPRSVAPLIAPFAYPFLSTDLFNSNKAIVKARKA